MQIKAKSVSGEIVTLNVDEIIEIDGRPFCHQEDTEQLTAQIARLAGRLDTIEAAIFRREPEEQNDNG